MIRCVNDPADERSISGTRMNPEALAELLDASLDEIGLSYSDEIGGGAIDETDGRTAGAYSAG